MAPFEDSQNSTTEAAALFKATRAVLEHIEFKDAALAVFNAAKDLVGATSGYVALLSKDGTKNELLFLDSGGVPCRVDSLLPMPVRGLREVAYRTCKAVYDNAFKDSEWVKFLPEGHAPLDNVLFAPLMIEGKAVGLIGLANKPGGFNEHDARMVSAFSDIAAIALSKNRVLEALQESEERFRALVENAPEGFYVISADGIITSLNPAFEDITGWHRDEWIGRHFSGLIHPDDLPVAKKWFQHVLQGNKTPLHELRVLSKSGEYIIAEFISTPLIKNGKIAGVSGITRDITERKHFEDALRDSEKKYRRLFENTSNGIVIFDSDTLRFEDVNTSCLNLYGYTKEEFLSLSPLDVSAEVEKSRISLQKGLDSEVTHIPLRYHKKKDGTVFPVEIFAGAFFHKGRKKGIGVIVDLTERMQAEEELRLAYKELKEKSENLARERGKLDASLKGREVLLRELHHRVKNNMQIMSSLMRLQARTITDSHYSGMFKEALNRITAMSLIHEKLYGSEDMAKIGFRDYIRSLAEDLFQTYGIDEGRISLKTNIEAPDIDIDKAIPLGLIINELITNSIKYAFPGDRTGEIRINIRPVSGNELELIVSDNGIGIPWELDVRDTKTLGMQLVTTLAEDQLKGSIEINRDNGTEFRIKFKI